MDEKKPSKNRAAPDARQRAQRSRARPDCRSTTIKARNPKISLALLSRRYNHLLAATAKMAILIVARLPSRLTRYSVRSSYVDSAFNAIALDTTAWVRQTD